MLQTSSYWPAFRSSVRRVLPGATSATSPTVVSSLTLPSDHRQRRPSVFSTTISCLIVPLFFSVNVTGPAGTDAGVDRHGHRTVRAARIAYLDFDRRTVRHRGHGDAALCGCRRTLVRRIRTAGGDDRQPQRERCYESECPCRAHERTSLLFDETQHRPGTYAAPTALLRARSHIASPQHSDRGRGHPAVQCRVTVAAGIRDLRPWRIE